MVEVVLKLLQWVHESAVSRERLRIARVLEQEFHSRRTTAANLQPTSEGAQFERAVQHQLADIIGSVLNPQSHYNETASFLWSGEDRK